jgi:enamine deaminase RidA (YjgF/YER057c/UK114 family)
LEIESRLEALGLALPAPPKVASHIRLPFSFVRVRGNRAFIAGHVALNADGTIAGPFGKVGADLTVEQAYESARLTALAVLGSLKRELGDLNRVTCWLRLFGMVNAAPGFTDLPPVINGFSDLILELYGQERGQHARSAVGMASLPFDSPVEVEGEVEIT